MLKLPHPKRLDPDKEILMVFRIGVGLFVALILFIIGGVMFFVLHSDDIPSPDISDLALDYVAVPNSENAFPLVYKAVDEVELSEAAFDHLRNFFLDPEPENVEQVREILMSHAEIIQHVSDAVERPTYLPPAVKDLGPTGLRSNELLNFLEVQRANIKYSLYERDFDEAIQSTHVTLRLGGLMLSEPQSYLQCIMALVTNTYGASVVDLFLHNEGVSMRQLIELRDGLPSDAQLSNNLKRAFQAEFQYFLLVLNAVQDEHPSGMVMDLLDGSASSWGLDSVFPSYFFKPHETTQLFATYYRKQIDMVGKPYSGVSNNTDDQINAFIHMRQTFPPPNVAGQILFTFFVPQSDAIHLKHAQVRATLYAQKTFIAIRLFHHEYGRLPERLEELVPTYFKEVPSDPFDGKPIRYDAERRLLWLVGEDLIDQGGSTKIRPGEEGESSNRQITEDMVWKLSW